MSALTLRFSHRYYEKVLGSGGVPDRPGDITYLRYCFAAHSLPKQAVEYDTRYYSPESLLAKDAKFFPLGPGPYLVLVLKTYPFGRISYRFYWTTIRRPWKRQPKGCGNCAYIRDSQRCHRAIQNPEIVYRGVCCGWRPAIPKRYRQALGRPVQIVVEEYASLNP